MRGASLKGIILLVLLAAAAAVFFYVINFHPGLFSLDPKNTGSFEYVRAGEEFLDKGLYSKAISLFEKAHIASPGNSSIISGLVFAYSKYAFILADSGKLDEAIEYLVKAFDIKRDPSTSQNLAVMYSRKALSLAQKGEIGIAMELFGEARRIAYDFSNASRNLGISLYNDGVTEFKQAHEEISLLCLKEASLAYPYSKIFAFTGDAYYKRGDSRRAVFYWHRAKLLDPSDRTIPEKINKAIREMKAEDQFKIVDLPHFEMRYKESLPIDAGLTARTLEKAYSDVGKDLAYFPKTKTKVFLYSSMDFRDIFKMPVMVRAFYDGNIRMPVPDKRIGEQEFSRYIYHEYAHAALSAKTMNNCPVWFSEGVAMREELEHTGQDLKDLRIIPEIAKGVTLASMDEEFGKNEIGPDRAVYYLLAYTVVTFIIDSWGMTAFQGILDRVSGGQHVVNAIDDELLLSERAFEEKWKKYIGSRY